MTVFLVHFVSNTYHSITKTRPAILIAKDIAIPLSSQIGQQKVILNKCVFDNHRASGVIIEQTQFVQHHQIIKPLGTLDCHHERLVLKEVFNHFGVSTITELRMVLPN